MEDVNYSVQHRDSSVPVVMEVSLQWSLDDGHVTMAMVEMMTRW